MLLNYPHVEALSNSANLRLWVFRIAVDGRPLSLDLLLEEEKGVVDVSLGLA